MIGYLFVFISAFTGATKGYFGKSVSRKTTQLKDSVFVNIVRMLFCFFISLFIQLFDNNNKGFDLDGPALLYGTCAGVFVSAFVVLWLMCIKKWAYMLISISLMCGMILTVLLSFIVFKESVSLSQMIGMGLLVLAVLAMYSYSSKVKGKASLSAIILLIACGVSSGLYDFSQKLFVTYSKSSISHLNMLSYGVSILLLLVCYIMIKPGNGGHNTKILFKETAISVALMAICLFANSYFKAFAAKLLPASQVYPIYQGLLLLLSAVMSIFLFKEKLNKNGVVGMILSFVALMLIK